MQQEDETYDKIGEPSGVRDATGEPVDGPAVSRMLILNAFDRPCRLVGFHAAHLQPLPVLLRKHGFQVALMLYAAGQDGGARPTARPRLLLALGNDELVLNGLVDYLEFVLVARLVGVFG